MKEETMQKQWAAGDLTKQAYDAYAPVYDEFNRGYMYERWTGRLLSRAEEAGIGGKRLLDVACGTGLSFICLLEEGWEVTGCDISAEMLERARARAGERAELVEADMRELPRLGEFDLVWAVNDPFNYLLEAEELEATLRGMGRNLAPDGIALFDVNTLVTYRTFFSEEVVVEDEGKRLVWQGQLSPDEVTPGTLAEARFDVPGQPGHTHVHRQRHFSEGQVRDAIDLAGLECVALYGELNGELSLGVDEDHHTKAVYLCRLK
jgi:SAM-dependent methyltransferase